MAVEMAIWRMTSQGPKKLPEAHLDLESRLEDMLVKDPALAGLELLVVGRQVATDHGGFIDVLGVDVDGQLHVLELKRDRTPRDVVAQTLDYGSWVMGLDHERASDIFSDNHEGADFEEAFVERFAQPLPDVFNADQQLTVVASALDPASDRIVEYLAERFGVPINAVFFRYFDHGDGEFLARTWLLPPEEVTTKKIRATRRRPWNGRDYYVVQGRDENPYRWRLARDHGLLNAGGADWYWKPLRNLVPGKRVFAYVGGAGYVGVGTITGTMHPAKDAVVTIDGLGRPLLDLPDLDPEFLERARSPDVNIEEMVVPVDWDVALPLDQAISETGLFASQVTVCKLRDQRTLDVVTERLDLDPLEP